MKNKDDVPVKTENRREFIGKVGLAAVAGVLISPIAAKAFNAIKNDDIIEVKNFKGSIEELIGSDYTNIRLKMQDDVRRALKKPIKERKWGMVIDLRKCVGCNACTVACIAENALPPGVVYRPVLKHEKGSYPNVSIINRPKPCMQCDNPPCVEVCPVKATFKRPDGIIEINYKHCIGCRYCLTACPYEHRVFDFGEYYTSDAPYKAEYDKRASFEYGKEWNREGTKSPIGNARKCTYCLHRLENGLLPQCVSTCIGGANYFGDLNISDSVIAQIQRKAVPFLPEHGTNPITLYIN